MILVYFLTRHLLPFDGGLWRQRQRYTHDPLLLLKRVIQITEIYLLSINTLHAAMQERKLHRLQWTDPFTSLTASSYLDLARRLWILATFRDRASFSSWLRSSSNSSSVSLFGMGTFCGVESWGGAEPRSITWFGVLKNEALKVFCNVPLG